MLNDLQLDLSFSDYSRSASVLSEAALDAGIHASDIGLFGEINNPGISDLDFVAVADSRSLDRLRVLVTKICNRNPIVRFCLFHQPVYIIKDLAPLITRVHTLDRLTIESLRSLQICARTGRTERFSPVMLAWFLFLLPIVVSIVDGQTKSLRHALLVHKNLLSSYAEFSGESSLFVSEAASEFRSEFNTMPSGNYFEATRLRNRIKCILEQTLCAFDSYCNQSHKGLCEHDEIQRQYSPRNKISAGSIVVTRGSKSSYKHEYVQGRRILQLTLNQLAFSIVYYSLIKRCKAAKHPVAEIDAYLECLRHTQITYRQEFPWWQPVSPLSLHLFRRNSSLPALLIRHPSYGFQKLYDMIRKSH